MRQQETVNNQSINQAINHVLMSIVAWQQLKGLSRKNIQSSMWKTLEILEIDIPCLILKAKVECMMKQINNFSTETSIFLSAG